MRRLVLTFAAISLTLWNTGCALVADGMRAVHSRSSQAMSEARERQRNKEMAQAAWREVRNSDPLVHANDDYADGFEDGFAAHMYRGTTEPPPLPPGKYRTIRYQNVPGYRAAESWIAGFRRGVEEAQGRGVRQLVIGPSSVGRGVIPAVAPLAVPEENLVQLPASVATTPKPNSPPSGGWPGPTSIARETPRPLAPARPNPKATVEFEPMKATEPPPAVEVPEVLPVAGMAEEPIVPAPILPLPTVEVEPMGSVPQVEVPQPPAPVVPLPTVELERPPQE